MALLKSIIDSFLNPKFGLVRNMVPKECHGWSSLFHWNCYFWGGRRYTLHTSFLDRPMFFFPHGAHKVSHPSAPLLQHHCVQLQRPLPPRSSLDSSPTFVGFFSPGGPWRTWEDLGGPGASGSGSSSRCCKIIVRTLAGGWNSNFAKAWKGSEPWVNLTKKMFWKMFFLPIPSFFPSHKSSKFYWLSWCVSPSQKKMPKPSTTPQIGTSQCSRGVPHPFQRFGASPVPAAGVPLHSRRRHRDDWGWKVLLASSWPQLLGSEIGKVNSELTHNLWIFKWLLFYRDITGYWWFSIKSPGALVSDKPFWDSSYSDSALGSQPS